MHRSAAILMGGTGTRFWPVSRQARPKQFLDLFGSGTLVEQTLARLRGLVPMDNVFLVTQASQQELVKRYLPQFPVANVLYEPEGRDTAPAIGFAAAVIEKKLGPSLLAVLPADHRIERIDRFHATMETAFALVEDGSRIAVIGVPVRYPATQFGYIQRGESVIPAGGRGRAFRVSAFKEKPDQATAERFLQAGDYFFNAGMFIGAAGAILTQMEKQQPAIVERTRRIAAAWSTPRAADVLAAEYPGLPKISFDYAVMERCSDGVVVEAEFDWDDVGSWDAMDRVLRPDDEQNRATGQSLELLSRNCTVISDAGHLVVTLGAQDLMVVHTPDATLVCHKSSVHEMRKVVERLQREGKQAFL